MKKLEKTELNNIISNKGFSFTTNDGDEWNCYDFQNSETRCLVWPQDGNAYWAPAPQMAA